MSTLITFTSGNEETNAKWTAASGSGALVISHENEEIPNWKVLSPASHVLRNWRLKQQKLRNSEKFNGANLKKTQV